MREWRADPKPPPKEKKKSTWNYKKKPTGERDLFVKMYNEGQRTSWISGQPLLPPDHPFFHHQWEHVLPKGSYKQFRLTRDNIVPMTVEEHHLITNDPIKVKDKPEWKKYFELKEALRKIYPTK